jgi:hypothetical protein
MDINTKNIKNLIKLMKKEGVLFLKLPEIELTLAPQAISNQTRKKVTEEDSVSTPQYTPEEIMMWSVPGLQPTEGTT